MFTAILSTLLTSVPGPGYGVALPAPLLQQVPAAIASRHGAPDRGEPWRFKGNVQDSESQR